MGNLAEALEELRIRRACKAGGQRVASLGPRGGRVSRGARRGRLQSGAASALEEVVGERGRRTGGLPGGRVDGEQMGRAPYRSLSPTPSSSK
jgi:hypothetical protein